MVSIQSLVEVKDLLRIRSLLARQCLAELLAVFVLTVGGLIEGEERKEVENPKEMFPIFFLGQVLTRSLTIWGRIGSLPKGQDWEASI